MRFKIDENLPVEVVELLTSSGHDAVSVVDQGMLWIHLDQNGKVREVYAKEHFLWDERGVYGLTSERTWGAAKRAFPSIKKDDA